VRWGIQAELQAGRNFRSHRLAAAFAVYEGLRCCYGRSNPVAPHITHALWSELGSPTEAATCWMPPWPAPDEMASSRCHRTGSAVNGSCAPRDGSRLPQMRNNQIRRARRAQRAAFSPGAVGAQVIVVKGKLVNVVTG